MTIFKEADLKDLPKTKKSKVKGLLSRGYALARGTVSPKFLAAELAKKHPVGKIWKKFWILYKILEAIYFLHIHTLLYNLLLLKMKQK